MCFMGIFAAREIFKHDLSVNVLLLKGCFTVCELKHQDSCGLNTSLVVVLGMLLQHMVYLLLWPYSLKLLCHSS